MEGDRQATRHGWEELTEAAGRVLVGCEGSEDWDEPGDTGGTDLTELATHKHDQHPESEQTCLAIGEDFYIHTTLAGQPGPLDHSEENVQPAWYAVRWIKRTS